MKKYLLLLSCGLAFSLNSYAGPAPRPMHARTIGQRIHHQNARIKAGHKDGELTNSEARELHGEEKGIKEQAQTERAADGGKLTAGQRAQLNQELNQDSRQIHTERKAGE